MKVLLKFHVSIYYNFQGINKPSKSVTAGLGRFIVLSVSASPKMVKKCYFNFFPIFLKGFRAV